MLIVQISHGSKCPFENADSKKVVNRALAEYSARMQWQDLGLSVPHSRERTLVEAAGRLHTLKALLPQDSLPEAKYVAELHNILDFMEKGSGLDLSRYRMASPVHRTFLRINIMALLGVCAYQSHPAPPRRRLSRTMPRAASRIH